jgi:hypothetical protein
VVGGRSPMSGPRVPVKCLLENGFAIQATE